jgi:hypothetical protein
VAELPHVRGKVVLSPLWRKVAVLVSYGIWVANLLAQGSGLLLGPGQELGGSRLPRLAGRRREHVPHEPDGRLGSEHLQAGGRSLFVVDLRLFVVGLRSFRVKFAADGSTVTRSGRIPYS